MPGGMFWTVLASAVPDSPYAGEVPQTFTVNVLNERELEFPTDPDPHPDPESVAVYQALAYPKIPTVLPGQSFRKARNVTGLPLGRGDSGE